MQCAQHHVSLRMRTLRKRLYTRPHTFFSKYCAPATSIYTLPCDCLSLPAIQACMLRVTVMFTPSHTAEDQSVSFAGSRLILVSPYQRLALSGYTLSAGCVSLQPCISVGNVGQLAVDLLINTLRLPRAGHLHHLSLLPLAGSGAYSHTSGLLHTAAEGELQSAPPTGSPRPCVLCSVLLSRF